MWALSHRLKWGCSPTIQTTEEDVENPVVGNCFPPHHPSAWNLSPQAERQDSVAPSCHSPAPSFLTPSSISVISFVREVFDVTHSCVFCPATPWNPTWKIHLPHNCLNKHSTYMVTELRIPKAILLWYQLSCELFYIEELFFFLEHPKILWPKYS